MSARQQRARRRRRGAIAGGLGVVAVFGAAGAPGVADAATAQDLLVTNTSGNAATNGSLGYEIAKADGDTDDIITFGANVTGSITPTSTFDITSGMTIDGPGAGAITISGPGELFDITTKSASVGISGLTLSGGSNPTHAGGAIDSGHTDLTLTGDVFSGDSAEYGGAVYAAYGSFSIVGSTFSGDSSPPTGGGGGALSVYQTTGEIRDSTFTNDTAGYQGGAIELGGGSSLDIEGSTFSGDSATGNGNSFGGAIADEGNLLTISGSTFDHDTVTTSKDTNSSLGGAIGGANGTGPIEVVGSTFTADSATASTATDGVGGAIGMFSNAPLDVMASTISGNSASGEGGAVYSDSKPFTLSDSIVAKDTAPSAAEIYGSLTGSFDLITSTSGATLRDPVSGSNLIGPDPQLGPLAANGGPTETMLPASTSPAINAGNAFGLDTDQRGLPRDVLFTGVPKGSAVGSDGSDIGAVEVQNPVPPPAPVTITQIRNTTTTLPSNVFLFGSLSAKRGKSSVKLTLALPGAGAVSANGSGIGAFKGSVSGQGAHTFTLALTKAEGKTFKRRGKGTVSITVTFTPTGGTASSATHRFKL